MTITPHFHTPPEVDSHGIFYNGGYRLKEQILLDPLAWQAVGKTRGWNNYDELYQRLYRKSGGGGLMPQNMNGYMGMMHKFIDHLADGKSIEESLTAITN